MLHMLPEAHKNRGLQFTQCKYWLIFVSQGTSFYDCKIRGIIQKVVSLFKIKQNMHIESIIFVGSVIPNLLGSK